MTTKERELLFSICKDIRESDDQIDQLTRLYEEVKRMIDFKED